MPRFLKWDIWLAKVKFEDSDDVKTRPVLIYNETKAFVISFKGTSSLRTGDDEYTVVDWARAGLEHETNFRLGKTISIEKDKFVRRIGALTENDRIRLQFRLDKYRTR